MLYSRVGCINSRARKRRIRYNLKFTAHRVLSYHLIEPHFLSHKQRSVASTTNGTTPGSNKSNEIISPKQQAQDVPKDTISPPAAENRATKIIKYTKTEATSPYVKSSSIAGLAPLVKRTGGLSAKLKSSSGAMHSHEVDKILSIIKTLIFNNKC